MYETGKQLFFTRGGTHDFSCASCHGSDDKRIRLQDLPNLTKNPGDGIGFAAWPAYRVSNAQMWGMQLRLNDCFRQMRWPEPKFGSDVTIALSCVHGCQRQRRLSPSCPPSSADQETHNMNMKQLVLPCFAAGRCRRLVQLLVRTGLGQYGQGHRRHEAIKRFFQRRVALPKSND